MSHPSDKQSPSPRKPIHPEARKPRPIRDHDELREIYRELAHLVRSIQKYEAEHTYDMDPDAEQPDIDVPRIIVGPTKFVDGVFEGGGALGTAYVGALKALSLMEVWFQRVAGTSAGAITAGMIAAGYSADEIEWLSAPPSMNLPKPDTLPEGLAPISFESFKDIAATSDISMDTRRNSIFYRALKGEAIDNLILVDVPTPPIEDYLGLMIDDVLSQDDTIPIDLTSMSRDAIRNVLQIAFSNYPSNITIDAGDILNNEAIRQSFADNVLEYSLDKYPMMRQFYNLLQGGGLYLGDTFLNTTRQILSAKVFQDSGGNGTVLFNDLPIELVVTANNLTTGELIVYSKHKTPDMEVAEAIRQSMSVPILFNVRSHQGNDIVDGGVLANFPFWMFTHHGSDRGYLNNSDEDINRTKLAFLLDESNDGNNMNCTDSPAAGGLFDDILEAFRDGLPANAPELKLIKRFLQLVTLTLEKEKIIHDLAVNAIQQDYPQLHIGKIPIKGYAWTNFSLNRDEQMFKSIACRGWETAWTLVKSNNIQSPIFTFGGNLNPYR